MKKTKPIKKTYPAIWDCIDVNTYRRKVPGGWLVWSSVGEGECMCFLSDPKYKWVIVNSEEFEKEVK